MKFLNKIALGIIFATIPVFAMANTVTTTIPTPVNISPVDNIALKSVNFTNVDWSDVIVSTTIGTTTSTTTVAGYNYEASFVSTVKADGSFLTPITASSLLASSSMQVTGVATGAYYWHVRAVAVSGATSTWSTVTKVLIDNIAPTAPGTTTLTASTQPATSTSNGLQMWSFIPSTDNFSGVARYEYNINSSSTWLSNLLNTSFATALGIGTHTLAIRAVDKADNISAISLTTFMVSSSSTSAISTSTAPKNKDDCKRGGWKSFLNFYFKNQGKCVSSVEKNDRDEKKEQKKRNEDHKKHEKEARKEVSKREKEIEKLTKKFEKSESKEERD